MGVAEKVWGEYPVYYKQPIRVCLSIYPPTRPY